jgi:hypothetical protein
MPDNSTEPEADIFTRKQKPDFSNLPPVESMPVLPPMRHIMDVDLAVNNRGYVMVFHDSTDVANAEYMIYDIDDAILYAVDDAGRLQDIGMPVQAPMRPHLKKAEEIHLIHMQDSKPQNLRTVRLVNLHYSY